MHDHDCSLTAQCQTHVLDGTHAGIPLAEGPCRDKNDVISMKKHEKFLQQCLHHLLGRNKWQEYTGTQTLGRD